MPNIKKICTFKNSEILPFAASLMLFFVSAEYIYWPAVLHTSRIKSLEYVYSRRTHVHTVNNGAT